jgi:1,4-dihydroxy-2-naphthoate octaprenyltransferase
MSLSLRQGPLDELLLLCSVFFSLFIQIGTNFANDYFDYINGADHKERKGPARAVASGWIDPSEMRLLFFALFAAAFLISIPLVAKCGAWSLLFVFSSIAFGILYTGGPKPLGYLGFGELLVLAYFGPVAVLGTYYVQGHSVNLQSIFLSLSPGLLSTAILVANNLRDQQSDRIAGKNTLVVRFGRLFGSIEYTSLILFAFLIPVFYQIYLPLLALPLSIPPIRRAFSFQTPQEAIPLLPQTALLLLIYTVLFLCR